MTELECLAIMPFAGSFDPVFASVRNAVEGAIPGESIHCTWLKDVHAAGLITDDIVEGIRKATLCVADLTGENANVMWETGYAMAAGKPTILISQDLAALPFDLQVHRVHEYSLDGLDRFGVRLAEAVRQTLSRYEVRAPKARPRPEAGPLIVAVSGSMEADLARARRRMELLLSPYLEQRPLWYCGSNGTTDDLVLEYLLHHGQTAVAVGYNAYDYSRYVGALIEAGSVAFLDASVESLPKGLDGPSARDELFAAKAALVVLFWDGRSKGTEELIRFYMGSGTNLLTGFV